jgi:hypothetical protein
MENNKNHLQIIEKISKNLIQVFEMLNITTKSNSNYTDISASLIFFYFSAFKFKLNSNINKSDDNKINNDLLSFLNETLILANSKFLIKVDLTQNEFINLILYLFVDFDIVNDYIEYLNKINKKYISIDFENLIKFSNNNEFEKPSPTTISTNFIQSYSKLNFTLKNIKKQLDSFINLSYKLNEIKKTQESPIK